jgi:hypothetical protein
MREADFAPFCALLDDTAALLMRQGQALSATQRAMYFRALAEHSLDAVRAALDAHVRDPQRGRFFPMPADLIAQLQGLASNDGRPGPEEAWATALRGNDEAETIVWTAETAQAWAIAAPVLRGGDEVGARMAFKEAYLRIVDEARRQRVPAAWQASLGHDPERRQRALDAAAAAGRLSLADVPALPAPRGDVPLLTLVQSEPHAVPEHARQALRSLAEQIAARGDAPPSADAAERERTEQLRAATAAKVAGYQGDAA